MKSKKDPHNVQKLPEQAQVKNSQINITAEEKNLADLALAKLVRIKLQNLVFFLRTQK